MTNEQVFFIQVLADHLHQRETIPPEGLNWMEVFYYARCHQVDGIVWHQCKQYLKGRKELAALSKKMEEAAIASLYNYVSNQTALNELKTAIERKGIRFFTVKGLDVANYYPIPAYRTMGDIDVVVSPRDRDALMGLMDSLGYKLTGNGYEKNYTRNNVKIEVHDHLVYKENYETAKRRRFFNQCWKYYREDANKCGSLDAGFHFLFLTEHTMRHFSGGGLGFRQFMDIAVFSQKCDQLNWKWIEEKLRKTDLQSFAAVTFAFCKRWWGIEPPIAIAELDDRFYTECTEIVLKNGVFGYGDEQRKKNVVNKQLSIYKNVAKPLRVIALGLRKVFLSYNIISNYSYCRFIKGKKYLLPAAWIFRIFYILTHKKTRIKESLEFLQNNQRIMSDREILLKKWGI